MVFTFLFEISDLWRHLAIFFNIFKIKPNVPFIGFCVKKWIILTSFFEVLHELIESIWKEFWAKIPVCIRQSGFLENYYKVNPPLDSGKILVTIIRFAHAFEHYKTYQICCSGGGSAAAARVVKACCFYGNLFQGIHCPALRFLKSHFFVGNNWS